MARPERHIARLFGAQPPGIPVALHQVMAREKTSDCVILDGLPVIGALGHNVQQGLKRRTRRLHAAILKVLPGNPCLRFHNGIHARGELDDILLLREHRGGRLENASQEPVDEKRRNPVAEAAGHHGAVVQAEIADLFQVSIGLEEFGVALLHPHAAPDLRDQQADVVVDAEVRSHIARRRGEARVPGEDERHQGVVQIHHRRQRVEGGLGQRALAAKAGCRRRLAGQAANEIHEQLGQFLVVDWTMHRQRRQAGLGVRRAASPSRQHSVHRQIDRAAGRNSARQPRGDLRQMEFSGICQVGPPLQVSRVGGAPTIPRSPCRAFPQSRPEAVSSARRIDRTRLHVPPGRARRRW